jgi:zinc protease
MRTVRHLLPLLLLWFAGCVEKSDLPEVPFEKYALANGLEVVMHEDRSDPVVSVAVQYHVGAGRETPGHTGFAHLFEHMMFQESQHIGQDEFFSKIQEAGGTLNGGTGRDGTVYYEVVPKNALELALWLEADRMGYLLSKVTPEAFANQQSVVLNEKKQRMDNRPYGFAHYVTGKTLYPSNHPCHWPVIGEAGDIIAATVADAHAFHKKWYGPNNATLVVAGDFDREQAREWVEKYFGEISAPPRVEPPSPRRAPLEKTRKVYYEDAFARSAQLTLTFPTIEQFHPDSYALDYLSDLLGNGKKTPLYKVIVEEKKLAPGAAAYHYNGEVAGEFVINIRTFADVDLDDVEAAVEAALARFETDGFSDEDLQRHKVMQETAFYNGIASVLSKSFRLGWYNEYAGSPAFVYEDLRRTMAVTPTDVRRVYDKYIRNSPCVSLSVVPKTKADQAVEGAACFAIEPDPAFDEEDLGQTGDGEVSTEPIASSFDRSQEPAKGPAPTVTLPAVWHEQLGNGLRILGIEHRELPLVRFALTIPGGMLLDNTNKVGVAGLMGTMMNEGTQQRTAADLQDAIRDLGAGLRVSAGRESLVLRGNCLASRFPATVALMAEILLEPRWDTNEFKRVKERTLESVKRRRANPETLATDVYKRLVYGDDHIFAYPTTGTEVSLSAITLDDLRARYTRSVSPSGAYLTVAGAVSPADVQRAFAPLAAAWKPLPVDLPDYPKPAARAKPRLCFVDVPGAPQSQIRIGYLAMKYTAPDFYPANVMNYKLGGAFNSVLNTILREEKGYTYGAHSGFDGSRLAGPFTAETAVKTSATLDSMKIFREQMKAYRSGIAKEDLASTRKAILGSAARRFEALDALLGMLDRIAAYDLPDDYMRQRERIVREMTLERHKELAQTHILPERMVYLVVGDAATQREPLEALGLGPAELLPQP